MVKYTKYGGQSTLHMYLSTCKRMGPTAWTQGKWTLSCCLGVVLLLGPKPRASHDPMGVESLTPYVIIDTSCHDVDVLEGRRDEYDATYLLLRTVGQWCVGISTDVYLGRTVGSPWNVRCRHSEGSHSPEVVTYSRSGSPRATSSSSWSRRVRCTEVPYYACCPPAMQCMQQ